MFQALIPENPFSSGPPAQLLEMGGPVMIVLIIMALAGLITFVYLMLYGALFAPRHTRPIRQSVQDWKTRPHESITRQLRNQARGLSRLNPLHHLALTAMESTLRREPAEQIRASVSQQAQQSLIPFEAPLKIIEVIAALAPLLGLLGTVMGMMEAFSTMASAEGRASASQLSGGIYQALTTTAAGLIVAIPFAALAAWIEFRLRRIHATVNSVLVEVLAINPASQAEVPLKDEAPLTDTPATVSAGQSASDASAARTEWESEPAVANATR
jgi:biopolymer transport protein ExbB